MDFVDMSGRPRPEAEIEQALHWVKKKIVRADFSDPEGIINCVTIKDALTELLALRQFVMKQREGEKP
jgi:hypothetical protein